MPFDLHKNFAAGTIVTAPSPASTGTTIVLGTGQGTLFPLPPFSVTIWPAGTTPTIANAEIVRVITVVGDTFTLQRAQEGTNNRTIVAGDQIAQTITAKTLQDIQDYILPAIIPAGTATAVFTTAINTSSLVTCDATGSIGQLTWQVDGVTAHTLGTTPSFGPLTIGQHTIKLTATTTSGTATVTHTVNVVWKADPFDGAQHDITNGFSGGGLNLPQWNPLPGIGPWRNKTILNEAQGYPAQGDGIARIFTLGDGSYSLLTKHGDRPGTSGGYRSEMEFTSSYDPTLGGFEFASTANLYDLIGNGVPSTSGHGSVRFVRLEIRLRSATVPNPLLYQNNFWEFHGATGATAPLRFSPNGPGTQVGWAFSQDGTGTQQNFGFANIVYDTWYKYVIEYVLDTSPTVGYIRIYQDTGSGMNALTTNVPSGTITTGPDAGKYFVRTVHLATDGVTVVPWAMQAQNYRDKSGMDTYLATNGVPYADVTVDYRNIRIGKALADVLAS